MVVVLSHLHELIQLLSLIHDSQAVDWLPIVVFSTSYYFSSRDQTHCKASLIKMVDIFWLNTILINHTLNSIEPHINTLGLHFEYFNSHNASKSVYKAPRNV